MTEAELFEEIRKLLQLYKWTWYHTQDSRGSNTGFPDLVMVKSLADGNAVILFRELKSEKGRLSLAQTCWIHALKSAGQDASVWRPSDMEKIERTLRFEETRMLASGERFGKSLFNAIADIEGAAEVIDTLDTESPLEKGDTQNGNMDCPFRH